MKGHREQRYHARDHVSDLVRLSPAPIRRVQVGVFGLSGVAGYRLYVVLSCIDIAVQLYEAAVSSSSARLCGLWNGCMAVLKEEKAATEKERPPTWRVSTHIMTTSILLGLRVCLGLPIDMPKHLPTFKHLIASSYTPQRPTEKPEKSVNQLIAASRSSDPQAASIREAPPHHVASSSAASRAPTVWVPGAGDVSVLVACGLRADAPIHP